MLDKTMRVVAPLAWLVICGLVCVWILSLNSTTDPGRTHVPRSLPESKPKAIVLTFGTRGGLCASGEECLTAVDLHKDGTLTSGRRLSEEDLTRVLELRRDFIRTHFPQESYADCGASVYDGSDPYLEFPELDGFWEPCQDLGETGEPIFDELLAILQKYDANA